MFANISVNNKMFEDKNINYLGLLIYLFIKCSYNSWPFMNDETNCIRLWLFWADINEGQVGEPGLRGHGTEALQGALWNTWWRQNRWVELSWC